MSTSMKSATFLTFDARQAEVARKIALKLP
jgi:hypothetical protein